VVHQGWGTVRPRHLQRGMRGGSLGLRDVVEIHPTSLADGPNSRQQTPTTGSDEIRRAYERLVADRPQFEPGTQQPTLLSGDLALTSSRLANGVVTVEVARRQADGAWLWVIDQPNVIS